MKKLSYILLIGFASFQFVSCNKTDENVAPLKYDQDKVNLSLVEEVKQLTNEDAQKTAFTNILNPDEQYYIFHEKVNSVIQNSGFDGRQKKMFTDLLNQFSSKVYSDPVALDAFNQFANQWFTQALKLFSKDELFLIIGTLSLSQADLASGSGRVRTGSDWTGIIGFEITSKPACKCSRTNDFCPSLQSCRSASCESSAHGCGLLWVNACNGGCRL